MTFTWTCTCGCGGGGHLPTWEAARQAAELHRCRVGRLREAHHVVVQGDGLAAEG